MKLSTKKVVRATQKRVERFKFLPKAVAISLCGLVSIQAFALNSGDYFKPNGWNILETSAYTGGHYSNVHTYKKGTSYVALVDVPNGAYVDMMQYQSNWPNNTNPTFWNSGNINYWWNEMPSNTSRVLAVNGQFFNQNINPTTLSFAVKDDGHLYNSGHPTAANLIAKQINIYPNKVTATDANYGNYVEKHAPTAIIGKNIWDLPTPNWSIGRTYLCAKSKYGGENLLLIYVTKAKTQDDANTELANWGCYEYNTAGMDGSGSSQMRTKGGLLFFGVSNPITGNRDRRKVPQALGIYNDSNH